MDHIQKAEHEDALGHHPAHHQAPLSMYFGVFFALMMLHRPDGGRLARRPRRLGTPTVALAIAVVKAALVILWFMHVLYSPRLTWIVGRLASFLWLAVLFVLTFSDYLTRGWMMAPPVVR